MGGHSERDNDSAGGDDVGSAADKDVVCVSGDVAGEQSDRPADQEANDRREDLTLRTA